jgi:hypothetical protein
LSIRKWNSTNNEDTHEWRYLFSFKFNNDEKCIDWEVLFSGYLNIPLNAIITTEGVSENIYFKRVYFSSTTMEPE